MVCGLHLKSENNLNVILYVCEDLMPTFLSNLQKGYFLVFFLFSILLVVLMSIVLFFLWEKYRKVWRETKKGKISGVV